jgi:hypothetical protein
MPLGASTVTDLAPLPRGSDEVLIEPPRSSTVARATSEFSGSAIPTARRVSRGPIQRN